MAGETPACAGCRPTSNALPQLLSMSSATAPLYVAIHEELGVPIGSIGPQRARCLERLRRSSAFIELAENEIAGATRGGNARA